MRAISASCHFDINKSVNLLRKDKFDDKSELKDRKVKEIVETLRDQDECNFTGTHSFDPNKSDFVRISKSVGVLTLLIVPFLPNQTIFLFENNTILLENEEATWIG